MTDTQSNDGGPRSATSVTDTADFLFYVLAGDRPSGHSSRHSLAGIDEVLITRGDPQGWLREGGRLTLSFDDRWMSARHARLYRREAHWQLDCSQAKNGGYQNGTCVTEALLGDGDVLELGHSFFMVRAAQPSPPGAQLDVSATALDATAAGLRSLSPRLSMLFEALLAVAPSGLPLVITGETGTGKELLARAVHERSRRRGPFVAVNCGALPETLVESELFGVRRGTFSGSVEDRPGLVRAADQGTLFLDEVVELTPSAQTALLRVLQEREVLTLGSTRPVPVDFRLMVASHCDLDDAVASGRFREDLRARLQGFTVRLPPLRERREDLGLILGAIATSGAIGEPLLISRMAAQELLGRPWKRNIRELERCLHVAMTLARNDVIEPHHLNGALSPEPSLPSVSRPTKRLDATSVARRERLDGLLKQHRGNVTRVAQALGKPRVQVYRWLKRYGLDALTYR